MRINARLDRERQQKLDHLVSISARSRTEVIKRAIDVFYEQQATSPKRPWQDLLQSGLVGCCSGPEDLSSRYKEELGDLLNAKW